MYSSITFAGQFDKYTPVNSQLHYRFVTFSDVYLVNCKDYPALIGELSPDDLVKISGDVDSRIREGLKLVNVQFGKKES